MSRKRGLTCVGARLFVSFVCEGALAELSVGIARDLKEPLEKSDTSVILLHVP